MLQGVSAKEGWNPRRVIERAAFGLFQGQIVCDDWVVQRSTCAPVESAALALIALDVLLEEEGSEVGDGSAFCLSALGQSG